jgi:starch synthase
MTETFIPKRKLPQAPPPPGVVVPPAAPAAAAAAAPAADPTVVDPAPAAAAPAADPTVVDPTAAFDPNSVVLTPEEIAAALAAENAAAEAAKEAELARLAAEAEEKRIKEEKKAAKAAAKAEKDYVNNAEKLVAKTPAEHVAAGPTDVLFFTVPDRLVAGKPAKIYINTWNSGILKDKHNVRITAGYNDWKLENFDTSMKPVGDVAKGCFYTELEVPELAYGLNFVLEADGQWDNNNKDNWYADVHFGKSREEIVTLMKEKKEYDEDFAIASKEIETERYEEGSRRENVADGEIHMYGRCIVRTHDNLEAGKMAYLLFNKAHNPIGGPSGKLIAHIGTNKFAMGTEAELILEPVKTERVDDDNYWYGASFLVPPTAYTLDFVISDEKKENWDNNDGNDYRLLVDTFGGATEKDWDARVQKRIKKLAEQRIIDAENRKVWEAARKVERAEKRRKARMVTVKQQQHIMTCEPTIVNAGDEVTIKYNPGNTNLSEAETVYITGGFNRWTHADNIPETAMIPSAAAGVGTEALVEFKVKVPEDAWMMDFVFSDGVGEGATYDNHFGRDYHVPIEGSTTERPPLHVMHVSVEMAPIAKVGGLGDVITALARAVADQGNLVEIILPHYQFFGASPMLQHMEYETNFDWGGCGITVSRCIVENIQVFFIQPSNGMFAKDAVYGWNDDGQRFDFFCNAALEFLLQTGRQPDILHCHDWSTAEVAGAFWGNYHQYGLWKPNVVFTIHNMNYGQAKIGMASAASQVTTTVSPSYAGEVSGHPAVSGATAYGKFHGVRNGIDPEIWDPDTDQFLPMNYNADTHEAGKRRAREEIQGRLGLTWGADQPLVGVVSRLTAQKGLDLIKHSIGHSLKRGAQFVLLGSAPDPRVQGDFNALAGSMGGPNAAFCFAFDEPLSHLVYAAADFILVPSMFEPCGLTQMISMRYGAVPVVRATGGLRDTVFDLDNDKERAAWEVDGSTDYKATGDQTNGFSFDMTDTQGLEYALDRALDSYYNDKKWFRSLQERIMRQDWSWNRPALDYIELYYAAIGK